jgi:hypothetical protein
MTSNSLPGRPASIEELCLYSRWPARLLGLESFEQKIKTETELTREYEVEQWKPLLDSAKKSPTPMKVGEVDQMMFGQNKDVFCCIQSEFRLMSGSECYALYHELIANTLESLLPCSSLVEIGAGYGSIILNMKKRRPFLDLPIHAYEWTPSGRELTKELAANEGLSSKIGFCDLNSEEVLDPIPPEGSIIFTSSVFPCIPELKKESILALARTKPKAVVHFEPIHEEYEESSLWESMVLSYLRINDYNRNALSVLESLEQDNLIEITERRKACWGYNALLPHSVLIWKPSS